MNSSRVRCYSGHTYAERPASFVWQDVDHEVARIEKEWREPGSKHFLVVTHENESFELCYNEQHDSWSVIRPGGKE